MSLRVNTEIHLPNEVNIIPTRKTWNTGPSFESMVLEAACPISAACFTDVCPLPILFVNLRSSLMADNALNQTRSCSDQITSWGTGEANKPHSFTFKHQELEAPGALNVHHAFLDRCQGALYPELPELVPQSQLPLRMGKVSESIQQQPRHAVHNTSQPHILFCSARTWSIQYERLYMPGSMGKPGPEGEPQQSPPDAKAAHTGITTGIQQCVHEYVHASVQLGPSSLRAKLCNALTSQSSCGSQPPQPELAHVLGGTS